MKTCFLHQIGYVIGGVCLSLCLSVSLRVCLSVREQDYAKHTPAVFITPGEKESISLG